MGLTINKKLGTNSKMGCNTMTNGSNYNIKSNLKNNNQNKEKEIKKKQATKQ